MKKIIFSIFAFIFITATSFASSGFEFILNVPIGMSFGVYGYDLTDLAEYYDKLYNGVMRNAVAKNNGIGFDAGVSAQIGYMFAINNNMGVSVLGELGYSHDSYSYISKLNKNISDTYTFESLQVGLLPKFNIYNFAIGIGGGVKIPFAGNLHSKNGNIKSNTKISYNDISNGYVNKVIPYIKLTFDYSIFFAQNLAINVGLYLGYDFGLEPTVYSVNNDLLNNNNFPNFGRYLIVEDIAYSSFDIGLQVGFKFGPSTK